jgi:hypothetical protein
MDAGSLLTASGVFVAASALGLSVRQARTSFEDGLAREYRQIAQELPVGALLGEPGDPPGSEAFVETLDRFYRYVDLTNEQIFLRKRGRIRQSTWRDWAVGINGNLDRAQFKAAWAYIAERSPDDFDELREFRTTGKDPARPWRRLSLTRDRAAEDHAQRHAGEQEAEKLELLHVEHVAKRAEQ